MNQTSTCTLPNDSSILTAVINRAACDYPDIAEYIQRLIEKTPLMMAIVLGIALLLAIIIIASLLKLSFST